MPNRMIYVLALTSIILGAIAQYLLKVGMNAIPLDSGKGIAFILKEAVTNIPLLGGLTCYGLSMIFWLYVLSQMELSKAYPMVSLGYVFAMLLGYFLLDESLNVYKIAGIILIISGVVFITKG